MLLDKKKKNSSHFSMRDILGSSSSNSQNDQITDTESKDSINLDDQSSQSSNYRHVLKARDNKGNITPQTSSSSLSSLFRKTKVSASTAVTPQTSNNGASSPDDHHHHHSHEKKSKHLKLKRFFKKHKHKSLHLSHSELTPNNEPIEFQKYGKLGDVIGTGASGSVALIKSPDNKQVYAVKKFRSKLPNESESDYNNKVKNEFKIGEIFDHQNLIHTMELIKHKTHKHSSEIDYYIVMEYCPYDFFNLVMSGLMSKEEVYCYIKQIINAVIYIHSHGLAHRDLKLDNCVVTSDGVLKVIDFGSAIQFRKYENPGKSQWSLIKATGIVGSDPYLAPEVFEKDRTGYDARLADVWSVAIIFCCMILKRFPWKIPQLSDPSYKAFAGIDDTNPQSNHTKPTENKDPSQTQKTAVSDPVDSSVSSSHTPTEPNEASQTKKRIPRGPERLLRALPAASHDLMKKMLEIDVDKRIFIDEIVNYDFYKSIELCHFEDNKFISASNHHHHLVTEEELRQLNEEKEKLKKAKELGK